MMHSKIFAEYQFLSTLSLRRATPAPKASSTCWIFLSTLSLRRATAAPFPKFLSVGDFYPRSPCGERPQWRTLASGMYDFYPRSPCGERRHGVGFAKIDLAFLSTLSLRRATYGRINDISRLIFLSTLSLRRATKGQLYTSAYIQISIHALLAESDRQPAQLLYKPRMISIHALLAESDFVRCLFWGLNKISIHALLAESDRHCTTYLNCSRISIHALLAESDLLCRILFRR